MTSDPMETPDITRLPIFGVARTPTVADPGRGVDRSPREILSSMPSSQGYRPASPVVAQSKQTSQTGQADVDWAQVRAFRQQAAVRLSHQVNENTSEEQRRAIGREIIAQILDEHVRFIVTNGADAFNVDEQALLAQAIFDALFGLGQLQALVDNPAIENIEVYGAEPVVVIDGDGNISRVPPIVDTEDELIDMLTFLATRGGAAERTFSTASPSLHLHLHGGHRLAASAWTTHQPVVVIRRHRLVDIELSDLVNRDTLSTQAAQFLRAAVRARKSIVVSGSMDAGKTTLVRALANEIDAEEKLGTIETEYELGLHTMRKRHHRVIAWEAQPGSGEVGANGRAVGEITLDELIYDALRMNLDRLIVGEVRGREVLPMFKAMQAGAGSFSTIHAHSARAAIERLVTCAMEAGAHVTAEFAYRQIAAHINLVIYVERHDVQKGNGVIQRRRRVTQIIALEPGEGGMPAITDVFQNRPGGGLIPTSTPAWIGDLAIHGYESRVHGQLGGQLS